MFPKHRFWDPHTSWVLNKRVNIVVESTGSYHYSQIYLQYFFDSRIESWKGVLAQTEIIGQLPVCSIVKILYFRDQMWLDEAKSGSRTAFSRAKDQGAGRMLRARIKTHHVLMEVEHVVSSDVMYVRGSVTHPFVRLWICTRIGSHLFFCSCCCLHLWVRNCGFDYYVLIIFDMFSWLYMNISMLHFHLATHAFWAFEAACWSTKGYKMHQKLQAAKPHYIYIIPIQAWFCLLGMFCTFCFEATRAIACHYVNTPTNQKRRRFVS